MPMSVVPIRDHPELTGLTYADAGHTDFAGTGVANEFSETQTIKEAAFSWGAELLTNNSFASDLSGWTDESDPDNFWSWVSGAAFYDDPDENQYGLTQDVSLTIGEYYKLELAISGGTVGFVQAAVDAVGTYYNVTASTGTLSIIFVATLASTTLSLVVGSVAYPNVYDGVIDSVSLKHSAALPLKLSLVNGNGDVKAYVQSNGDALLGGNETIQGKLTVEDATTINAQLSVESLFSSGSLYVEGAITGTSTISADTLLVSSNANITGDLTFGGSLIGNIDADTLDTHDSTYFLAASSYTAADVLTKIKTVDGAGSGLDADLLDGNSSAAFVLTSAYTAADVLAKLLTVDGSGSGIDADLLDGNSSAAFATAAHNHSATYVDVTGDTMTGDLVLDTGVQVNFFDELGDKFYFYSNTYGTGMESSTLTNWSAVNHRWRIGGADVTAGTQGMLLDATGLKIGTGAPAEALDVTGNIKFSGSLIGNVDADTLDGNDSLYFLPAGDYTAADVLAKLLTVDGVGSGLNADLLDGNSSAAFVLTSAYTAADVLAKLLTVDGPGSGIDADLLDGSSSAAFALLASAPTFTGALTSASDTDALIVLGRAKIGYVGHGDYAAFSHFDQATTTDYLLMQHTAGTGYLNVPTGVGLHFRVNNADIMNMTATGLRIGSATVPDEALAVTGNIKFSGSLIGTVDADTLEGNAAAYFLPAASYTAADVLAKLLTVDGPGSGVDADTLDGSSGAAYAMVSQANTFTNIQTIVVSDAATAAITNVDVLRHNSSGTAGVGFGIGTSYQLESSTTDNQDAGRLTWEWVTATHASRASRGKLSAFYTTTERFPIQWEANSTVSMIGFLDTAPVVKPAAYTQTYSTATRTHSNLTSSAPSVYAAGNNGYSTGAKASEVHAAVIASRNDILNIKQVVNQLIDDLQAYGLLQ